VASFEENCVRRLISVLIALLFLTCALWGGDLRRIAMVDLPGEPGFEAMAVANGNLVIAHPATNSVDIFNMPRRKLIAQIKNIPGASGVAVDLENRRVYISSKTSPKVFVVSIGDWSVENTITTETPVDHMLFSPDAGKLFLSSGVAQTITAIDPANPDSPHSVNVDGLPQGMAFDPQQKLLFVALQDQALVIGINEGLQIAKHYPVHGSQPAGLAINGVEGHLYVAVRSAVIQLDSRSGAETARVAAAPGVDRLWLDQNSRTLYAAAGNLVQVMRVSGARFVDTSDNTIELRGQGLVFDPSTNLVYVPGGREGKSKLLILKQVGPRTQAVAEENRGASQVAAR
jgi:DNA-binding beta-propeller fold protein YncE